MIPRTEVKSLSKELIGYEKAKSLNNVSAIDEFSLNKHNQCENDRALQIKNHNF